MNHENSQSAFTTKRSTVILLIAALVLLAMLAMFAPGVQLAEGTPFSLQRSTMHMGAMPELSGGITIVLLLRIMLALMLIAVPIYVVISLLTKEGRRRLIGHIAAVVLLTLLLQGLQRLNVASPDLPPLMQASEQAPAGKQATPQPEAEFKDTTSEDTVTAATIIIALLLALTAIGVAVAFMRKRNTPPTALNQLADDAQQALDALHAGDNLEETIQRCYRSMCETVQRERHIQRADSVTPSEFEESLVQSGLPRSAVHQLTELFERIRYGAQTAGEREQDAASDSLSAIIAACAAGARRHV